MIRRPPRSTQSRSSAASDVYKRQNRERPAGSGFWVLGSRDVGGGGRVVGMEQAWLLPAIPLTAFVILLLAGPYLPRRGDWLAIAAIGASFILFFPVLADLLDAMKHQPGFIGGDKSWNWISYADFKIQLGFFVDQITIVMLVVVSFVALMVQIYSVAYM